MPLYVNGLPASAETLDTLRSSFASLGITTRVWNTPTEGFTQGIVLNEIYEALSPGGYNASDTGRAVQSGERRMFQRTGVSAYTDLGDAKSIPNAADVFYIGHDLASAVGGGMVGLPQGGKVDKAILYITPEMLGAAGNDTGDDSSYIQAANDYAKANNIPLYLFGRYRTNSAVVLDCYSIVAHRAQITRTLTAATDMSEVVRFVGTGSDGQFRHLTGYLRAQFSGKPATNQTLAHAFVFEGVINSMIGTLYAGSCAYSFVNDPSVAGDTGRFWGNSIAMLYARGCVQGFMSMPTPGTGAHTENYFGLVYFNGKEVSVDAPLPKENIPINIDNGEGWVFGCLNFEWVSRNISSGNFTATVKPFIRIGLMTNLVIHAFHPEGLSIRGEDVDHALFYFDSTGSDEGSVTVDSIHINNWQDDGTYGVNLGSTGTLALVAATTSSDGRAYFGFFSGKTNTVGGSSTPASRMYLKNQTQSSTSSVLVQLGSGNNWSDFGWSNWRKGTVPNDLSQDIILGTRPYVNDVQLAATSGTTTLALQRAVFARITGTAPTALANITVTSDFTNERTREVTLYNETGSSITLTSGGNIHLPLGGTFPLTWASGRRLRISYDVSNGTAEIVGLSI